jgi:hypothetical protein
MSTIEKKPCTITWVCAEPRLFACEHGLFTWHVDHEITYSEFGNDKPFAEALITENTQAWMSLDGTRVSMVEAYFPLLDTLMYGGMMF